MTWPELCFEKNGSLAQELLGLGVVAGVGGLFR